MRRIATCLKALAAVAALGVLGVHLVFYDLRGAGLLLSQKQVFSSPYLERRRLVKSVCGRILHDDGGDDDDGGYYRSQLDRYKRPIDKTVMFDPGHNLTYCWVHKVASTSWNKVFFQLMGRKMPAESSLHKAAQLFAPASEPALRTALAATSVRFLVARHPFERIVSAYVDKFELGKRSDYIFKVFNPAVIAANGSGEKTKRPTFKEFVNYLLATEVERYNDHWIPQWLHCRVCEVAYDVISYLETVAEDSNFIAGIAGLSEDFALPWKNRVEDKDAEGRKPSAAAKRTSRHRSPLEYFAQLDGGQIGALYRIYKPDFDMFGYSAEAYLDLERVQKPPKHSTKQNHESAKPTEKAKTAPNHEKVI